MNLSGTIRVASLLPLTFVNGPGPRCAVFLQGCTLSCRGCWNPTMQDPHGGTEMPIGTLLRWLAGLGPRDGLSLSGGEPLEQPEACESLLRRLDVLRPTWTILLFTGYEEEEWTPRMRAVIELCDCVVAGRYVEHLRSQEGLLSSSNQKLHFLRGRIRAEDVRARGYEVILATDCSVSVTGFPGTDALKRIRRLLFHNAERPDGSAHSDCLHDETASVQVGDPERT